MYYDKALISPMESLFIHGGRPLAGSVAVSGSKNAALPAIAAALLTDEPCIIRNVPDIQDVRTMLDIVSDLGAEVSFAKNTVRICARGISSKFANGKTVILPEDGVCKLRASILLWGPLLARFGRVKSAYPGGCILGKRSIDTHVQALEMLGAKFSTASSSSVSFSAKKLTGRKFTLKEFSVTGTENAVMAAVLATGKTKIRLSATEPHVVDLCRMLGRMGAKISGLGTHVLVISGVKKLKGATHTVISDYLEAGTLTLAAVLTRGRVTIRNIVPEDLEIFWNLLREIGADFTLTDTAISIRPVKKFRALSRLQTAIHPGFPTDLQAPFAVLLTQCVGTTLVHETLFEDRFRYLPELKKMGARFEVLNPHQVMIHGQTKLRGTTVKSCDLRAGAAMVLAGLVASGTTRVTEVNYIDRGYERFEEKLLHLGAKISRK